MNPESDRLSIQTKAFVGITMSVGMVLLAFSLSHWQSQDLTRFACYLFVAVLAKLGLESRTEAALYALRTGLARLEDQAI